MCDARGCLTIPTYGPPGGARRYCGAHAGPGDVNEAGVEWDEGLAKKEKAETLLPRAPRIAAREAAAAPTGLPKVPPHAKLGGHPLPWQPGSVTPAAYYRRRADRGSAGAAYNLALCYRNGRPAVPVDLKQAGVWFGKARDAGHPRAAAALAALPRPGRR